MKTLLAWVVLIFVVLAVPARAGPFEDDLAAAARGDKAAQYNLGVRYARGLGVRQDFAIAVRWYTQAATQGMAYAQSNLGAAYALGQGVPKNYVTAHMWWNLAAAQGDTSASKNRAYFSTRMSSAQITKGYDLAREWLAEHRNK